MTNTIRRLREAKGFTQAELAFLLRVSVKTISTWERDDRPAVPRPRHAKELARRLGVAVEDLGIAQEDAGEG